MLRYTIIMLVVVASGCAGTRPQLSLAHNVNVPKEDRAGNFSSEHPDYDEGDCTIARYVDAYERGWFYAVETYAKNINYDDPSPVTGIGWGEEVTGYSDGYYAAQNRIQQLIRAYGERHVSAYLRQECWASGVQTNDWPNTALGPTPTAP